ncbi:hypothetical protein AB0A74_14150 [Saccharothrix sp. NPDC042600]|uniref:hypothetical protein n=1 Tax=Saccharothrix TaxID=2071 RepID=UPI0033E7D1D1|nr:hypothetical protein GCM10017745_22800 [Saccharothrix mutabilis subsp. capreolus]
MRRLLIAVLLLLGATATSAHADPGLHGCGTSVSGSTGNGWCSGTGTFRLVVACEDGKFARSRWMTIQTGDGTLAISCTNAKAVGAEIEVK